MTEDQLARKKLAIETRLKRVDQALARKQLDLAQAEFEWKKSQGAHSGLAFLLTPTGVVLVGAALGLLGTAASKWADYLSTRRQQETTMILKASEVSPAMSPAAQEIQRARNLRWFAEAGYIDLPASYLSQLRAASKLESGQAVPPPVVELSTSGSKPGMNFSINPRTVSLKPGGFKGVTYTFVESGGIAASVDSEDIRWLLADGTVLDGSTGIRILGGPFVLQDRRQVDRDDNIYLPPTIAQLARQHDKTSVYLELTFNVQYTNGSRGSSKALLQVEVISE
ncbi:hypothetical protein AWB81_08021 [Caballeronia arationis]|uniref:hypothetical protein n=1 Tax=Caballeronia arationis TaxID=1777142 RepID=UPI00074C2FEF|nr:hypothetical protein [Caballeronia arationis]SAL07325.1 hypothetical protein AWB81_08021 [Caballeronia arationis]